MVMALQPCPDPVGMCGVNCALAPCFRSGRCNGCHSDNPVQKRTSKWSCRIRRCVLERGLVHCGECPEFPCSIRKSLENRYLSKYRIDLRENIREISALGPDEWLRKQLSDNSCPSCGECADHYSQTCYGCGKPME